MWDTPPNYRRYPNGKDLPDKIKVWRVQQVSDAAKAVATKGVVSKPLEPDDGPRAETLTPGVNTGKMSGASGVGRDGNFLQWGFSAPPSQMTPAGKNFFLNCVVYISKFNGKAAQAGQ